MRSNLFYSILNVFINTFFPIVIFPYIARVLGAEGLGTYNYYNLTISYIALATSFGIGIYGVREIGKYKDNSEKRSQVALELFSINFLNAVIFFAGILIYTLTNSIENDLTIIFLFSSILFINAISVEWFFVGLERQKYILVRSSIVKMMSLGLIFYFVKNEQDLVSYVIIVILGLLIPAAINFYIFIKNISLPLIKKLNLRKHLAPLFAIFIVEVSFRYFGMADLAILGVTESKLTVGYYSLALNIFSIVISFIRISAITLLPRASFYLNNQQREEFNSLINATVKLILLVGIPISVGLYLCSDFIVSVLGGAKFHNSSAILKMFAPLIIISSIVNMIVFQVLYPQNQIKSISVSLVAGICINLVFNFFLIPIFAAQGVVISSIISQLIILLLLFFTNRNYISTRFFTSDQLVYLYAGAVLFIGLNFLATTNIIIQVALGGTIYVVALFFLGEKYFINHLLKWLKR